jgi:hypothetical protein
VQSIFAFLGVVFSCSTGLILQNTPLSPAQTLNVFNSAIIRAKESSQSNMNLVFKVH